MGICKGLHYLHEEKTIIHMDLKPDNILLDHQGENYIPKITDFGLSRPNEKSYTEGKVYGTRGYCAPEYTEGKNITPACDVYSLGAIIREVVTGCMEIPNNDNVLRRWRHRWRKPPTLLQYQQVTRCIEIAACCREQKPKDRPSIKKIIECLSESTIGHTLQVSPCLDEDDMLQINPLELLLPSELKKEMTCSLDLTNDTHNCIFAFNIVLPSPQYKAQPVRGIVQQGSTYVVMITVQAQDVPEHAHAEKFVVQSMQVEAIEGLRDEDITELMFEKTSKFIDNVDFMVSHEPTPQENCKLIEDDPVEEVPESNKRKIGEPSSRSRGKAEAASMCKSYSPQSFPANYVNKPTTSDPTDEVFGREDAIKEIRERLRQAEDTKRLSVIGIIGIPGSGKTTLAQCVCKCERSDSYFDLVMWIYVSQNFSMETIYGEMLEQACQKFHGTLKTPKYSGLESLKQELKMVLDGKLFLLILDDIWFGNEHDTASDEKVKEILIPLVDGKRESKILLTSRKDSLFRLGRTVKSTTYPIPDLKDAVFLDIFMQYAFDEDRVEKKDERRIKQIGAEIALKLKKSPLLARVVGSSLFQRRKIEVADWIRALDQNLTDEDMGALWWSYQHLGEQARLCFAYCSIFSRRHRLRRDKLVNLWVAEGFIDSTNIGQEMEYVGRVYFDELLSSSFLLPGGKDYDGEEYFLIHDLLYDLAVKVAGDDCFKIENSWTSEVHVNVRHLSIQSCTPSMVSEHLVKLKKLRTLIIYKFEEYFFSRKYERRGHLKFKDGKGFDNMFCQLGELRVLIFGTDTDCNAYLDFSFPKSIGFLKYLRYLGVQRKSGYLGVTLPDTIKKLYLLQVLDLGGARVVHSSFSEDLINLADLRRVYSKCVVYYPDMVDLSKVEDLNKLADWGVVSIMGGCFANMGRLTSLQTMPILDVSSGEGHELYQLEHLNNLEGKLIIHGLECVKSKDEALNAKLAQKELLTELQLSWGDPGDIHYSRDLQAEVLEALCPPENITDLTIECYDCSRYPTWMVGMKENTIELSTLLLYLCPQPVCGPGDFFIRVSSLMLVFCKWDTLPDMKHLTSLDLGNCSMPSSLENLTSLERLIIYACDDFTVPILPRSLLYIDIDAYSCSERENQIFEKVRHIPHIVLSGKEFKGTFVDTYDINQPPTCGLVDLNLAANQLNDEEHLAPTDELVDEELLEPNEDVETRSMINCSSCIHAAFSLCFIVLLRIQAICNSCLRS